MLNLDLWITPDKSEVSHSLERPTGEITLLAGLSVRETEYLSHGGGQDCGEEDEGGEHGEMTTAFRLMSTAGTLPSHPHRYSHDMSTLPAASAAAAED